MRLLFNKEKAIAFTKEFYIPLLKGFLAGVISTDDYEKEIIQLGFQEKFYYDDRQVDILGSLSGDAHAFFSEPDLDDPTEIGEEELRKNTAKNLKKLEAIVAEYETTH